MPMRLDLPLVESTSSVQESLDGIMKVRMRMVRMRGLIEQLTERLTQSLRALLGRSAGASSFLFSSVVYYHPPSATHSRPSIFAIFLELSFPGGSRRWYTHFAPAPNIHCYPHLQGSWQSARVTRSYNVCVCRNSFLVRKCEIGCV